MSIAMNMVQRFTLCGFACVLSVGNPVSDGCHADESCMLQKVTKTQGALDNVTMTLMQDHAMETAGVCYLRGDVHVVPFTGSKFSEFSLGSHIAFEVQGLQGPSSSEPGELSVEVSLASPNAFVSQATLTSLSSQFTFAAGDDAWSDVGTADPNNKLSFVVAGNVLQVSNNGDVNLPNGLLFEVTAISQKNHLNLMVSIAYGDGNGCPVLVDGDITPLTFSGLCGACDNGVRRVGNRPRSRNFVDDASNFMVNPAVCFPSAGLLRDVSYHIQPTAPRNFEFIIWRLVSGTAYDIISYPAVISSTSSGVFTHYFSPAAAVEAGDCLGWRHDGRGSISYDNEGDTVLVQVGPRYNVGHTVNLATSLSRTYSIRANYVPA